MVQVEGVRAVQMRSAGTRALWRSNRGIFDPHAGAMRRAGSRAVLSDQHSLELTPLSARWSLSALELRAVLMVAATFR